MVEVGLALPSVAAWLQELSLGHLEERFRVNGVDGEFLAELTLDDLTSHLFISHFVFRR